MWLDTALNTLEKSYIYQVELWGSVQNEMQFVEVSDPASSVFLDIDIMSNALQLSWQEQVPWTNVSYTIYKYN